MLETMTSPDATAADPVFTAARPRLFAIAYRMLGTRADAEDVLQDAWLRWHRTDTSTLQSSEAWLVTVVTRLAIDRLRAVKAEREAYVGWWLPEPLVEPADERTPEAALELAGELSLALLWAANVTPSRPHLKHPRSCSSANWAAAWRYFLRTVVAGGGAAWSRRS